MFGRESKIIPNLPKGTSKHDIELIEEVYGPVLMRHPALVNPDNFSIVGVLEYYDGVDMNMVFVSDCNSNGEYVQLFLGIRTQDQAEIGTTQRIDSTGDIIEEVEGTFDEAAEAACIFFNRL